MQHLFCVIMVLSNLHEDITLWQLTYKVDYLKIGHAQLRMPLNQGLGYSDTQRHYSIHLDLD